MSSSFINPFTPTDRFSSFQNNEWNSLLKLLSVERVKKGLTPGVYKLL